MIEINHFRREKSNHSRREKHDHFHLVVRDHPVSLVEMSRFRRAKFYPFLDARQGGLVFFYAFLYDVLAFGDGVCRSRFHAWNGSDRAATSYLVNTSGIWYSAEDSVSKIKEGFGGDIASAQEGG